MFSYLVSFISSGLWPLLRLFMFLMMEVLKVLFTYVCRMSLNLRLSNDFLITRLEMIWALGRKIMEVKLYAHHMPAGSPWCLHNLSMTSITWVIWLRTCLTVFYFAKVMTLWPFLIPVLWSKLLSPAYTQGRVIKVQLERIVTYIMWNSSLRKIYLFSLIYLFYQ